MRNCEKFPKKLGLEFNSNWFISGAEKEKKALNGEKIEFWLRKTQTIIQFTARFASFAAMKNKAKLSGCSSAKSMLSAPVVDFFLNAFSLVSSSLKMHSMLFWISLLSCKKFRRISSCFFLHNSKAFFYYFINREVSHSRRAKMENISRPRAKLKVFQTRSQSQLILEAGLRNAFGFFSPFTA